MGIRCLFGHSYGDPEVEREREEDGDEMIVTLREVKTCERCGQRQVVSENKEITTIHTPDEVGLDQNEPADTERDSIAETEQPAIGVELSGADDGEDPTDDGVILEDDPDESAREHGEWPDGPDTDTPNTAVEASAPTEAFGPTEASDSADASTDAEAHGEDADDASTHATEEEPDQTSDSVTGADASTESPSAVPEEDATILDAETTAKDDEPASESTTSDDGSERSEPQNGDETVDDAGSDWPTPEGEDQGFTAQSAESGDDIDFSSGGLTPDVETTHRADRETDGQRATVETQFVQAETPSTTIDTAVDTPAATELYCPNCEAVPRETSLRAGDICPNCHKGYLDERER